MHGSLLASSADINPNDGKMGIEKIVGNIEKSDASRDNHGCRDSLGDTILAKKTPGISGRAAEMPGGIVWMI